MWFPWKNVAKHFVIQKQPIFQVMLKILNLNRLIDDELMTECSRLLLTPRSSLDNMYCNNTCRARLNSICVWRWILGNLSVLRLKYSQLIDVILMNPPIKQEILLSNTFYIDMLKLNFPMIYTQYTFSLPLEVGQRGWGLPFSVYSHEWSCFWLDYSDKQNGNQRMHKEIMA